MGLRHHQSSPTVSAFGKLLDWAVPPITHARADELRDRIALFMRSFALYLLFFEVITVPIAFTATAEQLLVIRYERILQWSVIVVLFVCAAGLKRVQMPVRAARVLDAVVTVAIAAIQSSVSGHLLGTYVFIAICINTLVLTFRAAIVPSSSLNTFVVGVMAFLPLNAQLAFSSADIVWQPAPEHPLSWPALAHLVMLASVVCTAMVSRVIFGLRRTVAAAEELGAYDLVRKLGEGGMGEVYEARHRLLRRPTAVKVVRPERVGESALRRFELEVRETAKLTHPNTIAIYDYGRAEDGTFFYAMEMLDGLSLQDLVRRDGPMPVARVIYLMKQAAGALEEAHTRGLVHRDIKPANIMITRRGGKPDVVKVVDFGLVKDLDTDADAALTATGGMVGTPAYMAPEMHTRPEQVDRRADIYALGATAYFMLTGKLVFEGPTVAGIIAAHLRDTPSPASEHALDKVPPALDAILLRALSKNPDDRFERVSEFADALDAIPTEDLSAEWTTHDACAWWQAQPAQEEAPAPDGDKTLHSLGTVTRVERPHTP